MSGSVTRTQAAGLGILAALLLVVAWLTDPPTGPVVALAGGVIGWIVCRMTPRAGPQSAATVKAAPPAPSAPAADSRPVEPVSAPAPVPAPGPVDGAGNEDWNRQISLLRHDLRGILSPAMLIADRLLAHDDPAVQRAGELVNRTVERAAARLADKPV
jgi:hypothetical protein